MSCGVVGGGRIWLGNARAFFGLIGIRSRRSRDWGLSYSGGLGSEARWSGCSAGGRICRVDDGVCLVVDRLALRGGLGARVVEIKKTTRKEGGCTDKDEGCFFHGCSGFGACTASAMPTAAGLDFCRTEFTAQACGEAIFVLEFRGSGNEIIGSKSGRGSAW